MKNKLFPTLTVLFALATSLSAALPPKAAPAPRAITSSITGDYVEARTASVFAGACHYNGELVTTGNDALMAWHFTSGTHNGVDLTGITACATITSSDNLSQSAPRKTTLVIDTKATDTQAAAITNLLQSKLGPTLGTLAVTRRASISFAHNDKGYAVNAPGFGAMTVTPMAGAGCCIQPNLVWYEPLTSLENRKVGTTLSASTPTWHRENEDSAFYGTFTF